MVAHAQAGRIAGDPRQALERVEVAGQRAMSMLDRTLDMLHHDRPLTSTGGLSGIREAAERFSAAGPAPVHLSMDPQLDRQVTIPPETAARPRQRAGTLVGRRQGRPADARPRRTERRGTRPRRATGRLETRRGPTAAVSLRPQPGRGRRLAAGLPLQHLHDQGTAQGIPRGVPQTGTPLRH
ncbi:hypothetical protein [Nonomuraea sp. NPDC049709]|uniref:hypothetical protein n=1 Tax=Nonomuraea sp. NPDC049709 TaxID=3154736 RepID=UPI00344015B4